MKASPLRVYVFGPFTLDADDLALSLSGRPVPLKPKATEILLLLVENSGRIVSKDEMFRHIWPHTLIEESSLTQNIYELRKALDDTDRPHRFIENVARRGYRFVAEVTLQSATKEPAVAVLPFRSLSVAPAADQLGLGIADSITVALTPLRGLVVRPTSASSQFSAPDRDAFAAARVLQAAFLVDGNIQMSGDAIRVTVQLLETERRAATWARTFDGSMQRIFQLQDTIAAGVAGAILPELSAAGSELVPARHTNSRAAYELYVRGRYNWTKSTPEALWKAIEFFRGAVAADPDYALAYAGIADAYNSLDWYGVLSTTESNPHAVAAAERAIELDDSLAEAHASLAMARQYSWDWNAAEAEYRVAIALRPSYAQAHQWYATFLAFMGRFDEAIRESRRAEALDPASPAAASQSALVYLCARRYDDAISQLDRTFEIEPESLEARFYLGITLTLQHHLQRAIDVLAALPQDNSDFRATLAYACGVAGRTTEARTMINELTTGSTTRHAALFWLAIAHLGVGDHASALDALERACEDPDDSLLGIKVFAMLDPIRNDPRFARILERMGMTAESSGVR